MLFDVRKCDYCGIDVEIYHKHRLQNDHIFCSKECEGNFRKAPMNIKCTICGKEEHIKGYRLKRLKKGSWCCSLECSYILKTKSCRGSDNPNFKHEKNLSMFNPLTNDGAYILGLIWSDGHIKQSENTISIYEKDDYGGVIDKISYLIFGTYDNFSIRKEGIKTLDINDADFVDYVLSLGGVVKGKKSDIINMPNIPDDKIWSFICGYFDGDGGFSYNYYYPEISIRSNSSEMLKSISKYWGVNYAGGDAIYASGNKALDICGKMYNSCKLYHRRKYDYYMDILNWEPTTFRKWYQEDLFKYKKFDKNAIPPTKSRVTDSGYDVHAISITPVEGNDKLFIADTRLAVQPIPGYYFDMVGRSSLPLTGFIFAGGVGIIDRSYVGSLKMVLYKNREDAVLPSLPFKCGQIIPRRIIHIEFEEVTDFDESTTSRGNGGFGSTDK